MYLLELDMCQGLLELEAAHSQWSTPLSCRKLFWTPQKQWDQRALQPPSDLIKSIFSRVKYSSLKGEKAAVYSRAGLKLIFCVCISPYIIHIHALWHKTISLFSSLMFICSENYHQGTWIYCSPPSSWDRRFKAHCESRIKELHGLFTIVCSPRI